MDKDDENYDLMISERNSYIDLFMQEAKESGVEVSNWEQEEIELAFEYAFCKGFIACKHKRKAKDLN